MTKEEKDCQATPDTAGIDVVDGGPAAAAGIPAAETAAAGPAGEPESDDPPVRRPTGFWTHGRLRPRRGHHPAPPTCKRRERSIRWENCLFYHFDPKGRRVGRRRSRPLLFGGGAVRFDLDGMSFGEALLFYLPLVLFLNGLVLFILFP